MKLKLTGSLIAGAVLFGLGSIPAYAGLTFTPLADLTEGSIPSTLPLTATFTNDTPDALYLNELDAGFTDGGDLNIDPTPFFVTFARSYSVGESVSDVFFTFELPSDLAAGTYSGNAIVRGGPTETDANDLYTVPFSVKVNAALIVPEGSSLALSAVGLLFTVFHVKRLMKR